MTNEEFLLKCINDNISGLQGNIMVLLRDLEECPSEINKGTVMGMNIAIGMLYADLRLLERYKNGEMSEQI